MSLLGMDRTVSDERRLMAAFTRDTLLEVNSPERFFSTERTLVNTISAGDVSRRRSKAGRVRLSGVMTSSGLSFSTSFFGFGTGFTLNPGSKVEKDCVGSWW